MSSLSADSLAFVEALYAAYCVDPESVETGWRDHFAAQGAGFATSPPLASTHLFRSWTPAVVESSVGDLEARVRLLVQAYRNHGHLRAQIDPIGVPRPPCREMDLATVGLEGALEKEVAVPWAAGRRQPLRAVVAHLERSYCAALAVQTAHIGDPAVRAWVAERCETDSGALDAATGQHVLARLTEAEAFESFVHTSFLGAKRFSLEGAEVLIPALDEVLEQGVRHGVEQVVLGMAHRGRLNVLVNLLGKRADKIFREFEDRDPPADGRHGDVKYHLGYSGERQTRSGTRVHLSLSFNPSHLAFVGTVVAGRARAKQVRMGDALGRRVLPVVVHGDAAFTGQGGVQEGLNMSSLPGYHCGGTLHIIVNNQVGFTTSPAGARSGTYAADVARMLDVPLIHVNGESPAAVLQAMRLAVDFRAAFHRDVVVDLLCYRRYGHNEGDEPTFTQPVMYRWVQAQPTSRQRFLQALVEAGETTPEAGAELLTAARARLDVALKTARGNAPVPDPGPPSAVRDAWAGFRGGPDAATPGVETGVAAAVLTELTRQQVSLPQGFTAHPKVLRILEQRQQMSDGARPFDWGGAEVLAYASLLAAGISVRISGQDSGRGTFSHRHAVLYDHQTGAAHMPLQQMASGSASCQIWDSPLSESGVLGFDYGYSLDYPETLVIWEAQFGDFVNGAQVIIDQFITSGEEKWSRLSGIVLLLPHGFEGQGPEHSSARLERFLGLAAGDNIQICQPTTPAQVFHLLRRQAMRPWRKPLIVMTPKSLLRRAEAVSQLGDLVTGHYRRILDDTEVGAGARRVVLCSGKIYYDLLERRRAEKITDVAIVRLEQLYPLSDAELQRVMAPYGPHVEVMWVQEEPRNMGAWPHLQLRFGDQLLGAWRWSCISRAASASPATGSSTVHKAEQAQLMEQALAPVSSSSRAKSRT